MSKTAILAAAIAVLLCAPAAVALPGDPGFAPTSPADGATLPVDPDGIPVAFSCPVYRISDAGGGFAVYGGADDYGVSFATSPTLGADGRLADSSGRIHAAWVQGRALRYRRTSKSASRLERTHILASGASYFNLFIGAGANGRGWVAWDSNGPNRTVRAIVAP